MGKIYAIIAQAGQYEDYRERIIRAFRDLSKATDFQSKCQTIADDQYDKKQKHHEKWVRKDDWDNYESYECKSKLDKGLDRWDHTTYRVEEVRLDE